MKKLLKPALAVALAAMSTGAMAQNYRTTTTGEEIIFDILDNVLDARYQNDRRYQNREYQDAFRRADVNRDGILSRYEIDNYRARYGYDRNNRNGFRYDRRGVRVSDIDTNRDGWISRNEEERYLRMLNAYRR